MIHYAENRVGGIAFLKNSMANTLCMTAVYMWGT